MSSQVMSFADQFRPTATRPPGLSFLLVPLVLAALVDLPGDFRAGTISALGVLGAAQVMIAAVGLLVGTRLPARRAVAVLAVRPVPGLDVLPESGDVAIPGGPDSGRPPERNGLHALRG